MLLFIRFIIRKQCILFAIVSGFNEKEEEEDEKERNVKCEI